MIARTFTVQMCPKHFGINLEPNQFLLNFSHLNCNRDTTPHMSQVAPTFKLKLLLVFSEIYSGWKYLKPVEVFEFYSAIFRHFNVIN